MIKPARPLSLALLTALLSVLAAAGVWLVIGQNHEPDANFIVYRFAENLVAGRGLTYWTAAAPDVTTYPLVPAILAFLKIILPGLSLPMLGGIVSIIAAAAGGVLLSRITGSLAGIAYAAVAVAQPSPVVLTAIALGLAALVAVSPVHSSRRWLGAGVLTALAILTDPSAIILALLILALALSSGVSVWRYLLPAVLIPAVVLAFLSRTADPQGALLFAAAPGVVALLLPAAAIVALFRSRAALRMTPVAILAAWGAITAFLALLGGSWPTGVLLPGAIALVATLPFKPTVLIAAGADTVLALALASPTPTTPLGQWLVQNTGPQTHIATTDIGAMAYTAARPIIDLSGKLQQVSFDQSFFLHYAPDGIVLKDGDSVPWQPFSSTYAKLQSVNGESYYQRVVNFAPLDDHGVDVHYGVSATRSDLHLTNVALGNDLHPGDLVRIRLDWEFAYPQPPHSTMEIKLTLLTQQGQSVQGILDKIPPGTLPAGKISTYHVIPLPGDVKDGPLMLYLGVGFDGSPDSDLNVAVVNVSHPAK